MLDPVEPHLDAKSRQPNGLGAQYAGALPEATPKGDALIRLLQRSEGEELTELVVEAAFRFLVQRVLVVRIRQQFVESCLAHALSGGLLGVVQEIGELVVEIAAQATSQLLAPPVASSPGFVIPPTGPAPLLGQLAAAQQHESPVLGREQRPATLRPGRSSLA